MVSFKGLRDGHFYRDFSIKIYLIKLTENDPKLGEKI